MSGETTIKVVFITRLRFKVKLLDHCIENTQGTISCWSGVLRRNWGLSLTEGRSYGPMGRQRYLCVFCH